MIVSKLYSVWIDGNPSPVLSAYSNDGEAMSAFRSLILSVRSDIKNGTLEAGCDSRMELYCQGCLHSDGVVRGLYFPECIMASEDVNDEVELECEVVE